MLETSAGSHPNFRAIRSAAFAGLMGMICLLPASAQGTHLWTQSRLEEFEKGTSEGVAIASDGYLRDGPGLKEIAITPSTFVWSVAVDSSGTAYLGTASPASVLRVEAGGKITTLLESKDVAVQAVSVGPDGYLYAATLPSGKIYRLKTNASEKATDANGAVVFDLAKVEADSAMLKGEAERTESKSRFIWALTFDPAGRLYVATGGPAAIYRIDPSKAGLKPELFFKSDEQHLRCVAWDSKGNLIAGTDGSGLVYRISAQGKGYVLFESPRREITSIAINAAGTIYAASVGDKGRNPLPPLPIQGAAVATITVIQPGSMQAANSSTTLPEGTDIYALVDGQAPRKLWSGKDEVVYALTARGEGILAVTGNRGRVFSIRGDGSFEDIGHIDAQQGLSLASGSAADANGRVLIGSGNTGKLYELGKSENHEYASDVLDAGAFARFGRVEIQPGSKEYEMETRTGNVEQPARSHTEWGWSDWQPLKDGSVDSPPGRYLQWKAILKQGGIVGSVGINYLPVNAAPVVDEVVVVPGARVNPQNTASNQPATVNIQFPSANQGTVSYDNPSSSPLQATKDRTAVTVRWTAHDDDGDDLIYSLFLRGDGETVWRLLKDNLTEKAYSFDANLIPDGGYRIKVLASNSPSHNSGEALTGFKESDRFEVDTTPPVVTGLAANGEAVHCESGHCTRKYKVSFKAQDSFSPIGHAEYSLDAGPWQYIEPPGGLSDSQQEQYEVGILFDIDRGKMSEHLFTVRVYDRKDNVGVAKIVILRTDK